MNRKIDRIILHCSANSNPARTAAEERRYHMDVRGFHDLAYHFFIRTDGLIEKGRDLDVIGAHCEGYNKTSIGICLNGRWPQDFKDAQFEALESVLRSVKPLCPSATIHPHSTLEVHGKECPVYGVARFQSFWAALP